MYTCSFLVFQATKYFLYIQFLVFHKIFLCIRHPKQIKHKTSMSITQTAIELELYSNKRCNQRHD